jgi:hypothetical protein
LPALAFPLFGPLLGPLALFLGDGGGGTRSSRYISRSRAWGGGGGGRFPAFAFPLFGPLLGPLPLGGGGGGAAKASLRESSVKSVAGRGAASTRLLPRRRRRVEVENCILMS